jgi:hypothetical protein
MEMMMQIHRDGAQTKSPPAPGCERLPSGALSGRRFVFKNLASPNADGDRLLNLFTRFQ